MAARHRKTLSPTRAEKEKRASERQAGADREDACRCKEVSDMKPRKLLGLMISDLAFWKKAKKI